MFWSRRKLQNLVFNQNKIIKFITGLGTKKKKKKKKTPSNQFFQKISGYTKVKITEEDLYLVK